VVSSFITAVIVYFVIPETLPKRTEENITNEDTEPKKKMSFSSTLAGYWEVLKDWQFMLFIAIGTLTTWIYMQFNSTLPIFLLDVYGFSEASFGLLLSFNALTVVLFQFIISRLVSRHPPMIFMAIAVATYGIGFVLFGFINSPWQFFLAIGIITAAELINAPHTMSIPGLFAPEHMRGRYQAVSGWRRTIPRLFGIMLSGYILDTSQNPAFLWYIVGMVALVAMGGFIGMHFITKKRLTAIKVENGIATKEKIN
jgi:MFS family permease